MSPVHALPSIKQQEQLKGLSPVRVLSSVKPSRFQSLTVLSAEAVASWRTSGLSKHFNTYLPAADRSTGRTTFHLSGVHTLRVLMSLGNLKQ